MSYGYDHLDGKDLSQTVITADTVMGGEHWGTVHVEQGTLTISGTLEGTLDVQTGAKVIITGTQDGTVVVAENAIVVVEAGGMLDGTLANNGTVIVRGAFDGAHSGNKIVLEGDGRIE